ncbi:MAG: hypothetical protein M0R49_12750 [Limnochordia bacterium]|nr:hypothetical protein [Limnochordia bacterium]
MLATVVNAGVLELQTLKSDLSEQLESQYEQLLADLEAKAEELTQHLPQRTTHSPLQVEAQPPSTDSVTEQEEEVFASEKPVFGVGEWGERERLIREMYKLGMNVEAIAKELNIGKGEVSLVLDLARHEGTS